MTDSPTQRYTLEARNAARFAEMLQDCADFPLTHENWYLVRFDEGDYAWMKESEMEHQKQ